MSNLEINIIGYTAALITNISIYPQAYDVYIIVSTNECEKLNSLSLIMYILQSGGCMIWLCYGILLLMYPIIIGSILRLLPSIYIIYSIMMYRPQHLQNNIEAFPYSKSTRHIGNNTENVFEPSHNNTVCELII